MDNFIGKEKTLKSDMIYEGKILNLRVDTIELNNKMYVKREIVEHNNAVAIIALDKDLNMFFIRQYRKAVEEALLEIPAGIIENNEEPKEAAIRETMAELGRHICDSFYKGCAQIGQEDATTLAVIDLSKIPALVKAYDTVGAEALLLAGRSEDSAYLNEFARCAYSAENYGGNNDSEGYTNMAL